MRSIRAYSLPPVSRRILIASFMTASVLTGFLGGHLAAASFPTRTTVKVTIPFERRTFKVQNDFAIVWLASHLPDNSSDRIELFSRFGERLFTLNPLKAVQGATEMSIWDVAVGPTGLLAVAAVYANEEGRHIVSLLVYSSSGSLVRAYSPGGMGRRLAVDEDENVWVLGENWGDEDVPPLPVVSKFNQKGELVGRYVSRADLPPLVSGESGPGAGPDAIGLTKDGVWFWLPERRALVTFHKDGTHIGILRLGTPEWKLPEGTTGSAADVIFGKAYLLPTGKFIVPFAVSTPKGMQSGIYTWEKSKGAWKPLSPPGATLPKGVIAGTDGDRLVFGTVKSDRPEIDFESVDLP